MESIKMTIKGEWPTQGSILVHPLTATDRDSVLSSQRPGVFLFYSTSINAKPTELRLKQTSICLTCCLTVELD